MKNSALFAISLAVVNLAACNKKEAEPAADMATVAAADDIAGTQPAQAQSTGQSFANLAAASDMFEIEASKLAAHNAGSAKVKAFAEKMIKAHTASSKKLTQAAGQAAPAITPAPVLSAARQTQLDELRTMSGTVFDDAYARAQVSAHQAALDALNGYAAGGDQPSLKKFASDLIPDVTAHLNMAKAL